MTLQSQYDALPAGGVLVIPVGVHRETLVLDPARPVVVTGEQPQATRRFGKVGRAILRPPDGSRYAIEIEGERVEGFHFRDFAVDVRDADNSLEAAIYTDQVNHLTAERVDGIGSLERGPVDVPLFRARRTAGDASWHTLIDCWAYGMPLCRYGGSGQERGHNHLVIRGGGVNLLARVPKNNPAPYRGPDGLAGVEVAAGDRRGGRGPVISGFNVENAKVGIRVVGQFGVHIGALTVENITEACVDLVGCRGATVDPIEGGGRFPVALRSRDCRRLTYAGPKHDRQ